ncbi:MAG TPA: hypothetical protein VMT64_00750 [Candidatus Binataceae bacterium]|nr:hypothetical protein [Candidatus Binataceae bacterium]
MRWIVSATALLVVFAGCSSKRPPAPQQGSAYHPPEPRVFQTNPEHPTTAPIPVTLNADGYFTADGMRTSFLRECAEATVKDGYQSFAVFHYTMRETRPHHYEAHGEMVEARDRVEDPGKNVFDAHKILADPKLK